MIPHCYERRLKSVGTWLFASSTRQGGNTCCDPVLEAGCYEGETRNTSAKTCRWTDRPHTQPYRQATSRLHKTPLRINVISVGWIFRGGRTQDRQADAASIHSDDAKGRQNHKSTSRSGYRNRHTQLRSISLVDTFPLAQAITIRCFRNSSLRTSRYVERKPPVRPSPRRSEAQLRRR